MYSISKLLSGQKTVRFFLLASFVACFSASLAKAQLNTQVIWDKYEASNTFWGSANMYSSSNPSAALLQDITFGLKGTDEVRAASISLISGGKYNGFLEVNIYTAFLNRQNSPTDNWPILGDLFLSTTGWNPYVPANANYNQSHHYTADDSSKGTRWNVAFDSPDIGYKDALYSNSTYIATQKGGVHVDTAASKMNYAFDTRTAGRANQEVAWASGGKSLGDYVFEARHATAQEKAKYDLYTGLTGRDWSVYSYVFDPNMLGLKDGQQIGLRWQPTCANDILEGSFEYDIPKTPEPSTYAIFGVFGIALVVAHRKWSRARSGS
jgi:hypothetical protein